MRPDQKILLWLILALLLAACGGTPTGGPVLPTATPGIRPTEQPPTATPLPPPTVTPFPTLAGGEAPPSAEGGSTGGGEAAPAEGNQTSTPADQPPADQPTAVPPPPTEAGATGLPEGVTVGDRIFRTDFAGWPEENTPTALIYLVDGLYVFKMGPYDGRAYYSGAVNHSETYTQLRATPEQCSIPKIGYGLQFRRVDSSNYYTITIFCDNRFTVVSTVLGVVQDGFANSTLPEGMNGASQVSHTIGVWSSGQNHRIYFDNQLLFEFQDSRHQVGDVAVYAASQSEGVIIVAFETLEVWALR